MLTIHNRPDGGIIETNYWQSEYNHRDLAYLSGHNLGLRLLLPTVAGAVWLPEIKTGKSARIEPPVRAGYLNHIDIVFDDGTDNPFSLCLDRRAQLDRALRSGNTRLIIYAGSLDNILELPCVIDLPDAPKQEYLTHATATTGHSSRCYRHDLPDDVMAEVASWLPDMLAGKSRGIYTTDDGRIYAARCEWDNAKAAGFVVSRLNDMMRPTDIVRVSVCRHSKRARPAWEFVGGKGQPPRVPFVAAELIEGNASIADMDAMPAIGSFEQFLAWAWLEQPRTPPPVQKAE